MRFLRKIISFGAIGVLLAACHAATQVPDSYISSRESSKEARASDDKVVIVSVLVLADGSVADVKLLKSCGDQKFDDAALGMYRNKVKFIAAIKDGKPVDSWKTMAMKFKDNKLPAI